ncbi:hypothetical protein F2Q70_00037990 [Brassica cretica]|uniref:Uncharacterized protein n=1 Tax=Brassica cretica TaxID=69181 RepID=A0A8S9KD42_BRACR|nr:hypothetical protein F2Q70_00037990 [Brassica cretica]
MFRTLPKTTIREENVAYGTRLKVSFSLSSLLSFFAGVKSKDLKRKRSVTFVDVDHHRNYSPQAQTRPSIDAKTSEFASGFLGLSSNQSPLFYSHQSPLFRVLFFWLNTMKTVEIFMISLCSNTALFLVSADPQTCPADSGAKCSGSGDWEGEFFPEIPHITTRKQGDSDGRNRQKFVGIDRFRRISDEPIRRYRFVGKKKIRRNFVRTSDDFLTNTEKRHSDELPMILRCGHTRPEFIGKTIYRRRTFLRQFRQGGFLGIFRRILGVGIYRRTLVRRKFVGKFRRNTDDCTVNRNVVGSSSIDLVVNDLLHGLKSSNPLAYKWYNAEEEILGSNPLAYK